MTGRIHQYIAGAVVAALLATGVAFAQGPRGGGPGGPGRAGGLALRRGGLPLGALSLTQAQQDLVRDIRERNRESSRPLEQRLRQAHATQRTAIESIPANESAIRAATLALAEVQAEVAIHQARMQNEIWNALTAEQQAEVKKLQAERGSRRAQPTERRLQRQ
jgi:Spy/CpxP family protein refolding chaperone